MTLSIPGSLSSKLVELNRLLKQSDECTTAANRLCAQLSASGPRAPVLTRLDVEYSRGIDLSAQLTSLASLCVRELEELFDAVGTSTKRGVKHGDKAGTAAAAAAEALGSKAKRARVDPAGSKAGLTSTVDPGLYTTVELPLVEDSDASLPLCGVVPSLPTAVFDPGTRVVARLSGPKVEPPQWSAAMVTRHLPAKGKVMLSEEEDWKAKKCAETAAGRSGRADEGATPRGPTPSPAPSRGVHTIAAKFVVPLPTSLPVPCARNAANVLPKGARVLARYPRSTRFRKGLVSAPPTGDGHHYVITFPDAEGEESLPAKEFAVPMCWVVAVPGAWGTAK